VSARTWTRISIKWLHAGWPHPFSSSTAFSHRYLFKAPATWRHALGNRTFPVTGARAWKVLQTNVTTVPSISYFQQLLKTSFLLVTPSFNCKFYFVLSNTNTILIVACWTELNITTGVVYLFVGLDDNMITGLWYSKWKQLCFLVTAMRNLIFCDVAVNVICKIIIIMVYIVYYRIVIDVECWTFTVRLTFGGWGVDWD